MGKTGKVIISIDGLIGDGGWLSDGISSAVFAERLAAAGGSDVELQINSPGGSATEGFAIANQIAAYSGRVDAVLMGACCSAATIVACACETAMAYPLGLYMVHKSSVGGARGTAKDMESAAEMLTKIDVLMRDEYVRKSRQPVDVVDGWLSTTTWFTAEEAASVGLIDGIVKDPRALTPQACANLDALAARAPEHIRARLAQARAINAAPAAAAPQSTPQPKPTPPAAAQTRTVKMSKYLQRASALYAELAALSALAKASPDAHDQSLAAAIDGGDLPGVRALVSSVTPDAELAEAMALHKHVVAVSGETTGLVGWVDAVRANAAQITSLATGNKLAQVEAMLSDATTPKAGAPRKLSLEMANAQREAYRANPAKPIADLQALIKYAAPLPDLNVTEDVAAHAATSDAPEDAKASADLAAQIDRAIAKTKILKEVA